MENKKLTREQLINRVAGRLFVYRPYDNLSQMPQYLQDIYKEKAKVVLKNIEICINNKHDAKKYINVIADNIQSWFVAIDVASTTLISPEVALLKGTLTKEEAQGENLPDEKHSDLFNYLGQEGVNKIGGKNLLAYKDLPIAKKIVVLTKFHHALVTVNDRDSYLRDQAIRNEYSLQNQVDDIFDEINNILDNLNKNQEKE